MHSQVCLVPYSVVCKPIQRSIMSVHTPGRLTSVQFLASCIFVTISIVLPQNMSWYYTLASCLLLSFICMMGPVFSSTGNQLEASMMDRSVIHTHIHIHTRTHTHTHTHTHKHRKIHCDTSISLASHSHHVHPHLSKASMISVDRLWLINQVVTIQLFTSINSRGGHHLCACSPDWGIITVAGSEIYILRLSNPTYSFYSE